MTITEITALIEGAELCLEDPKITNKEFFKHELKIFNELLKCKLAVDYFQKNGTQSDKDIVDRFMKGRM